MATDTVELVIKGKTEHMPIETFIRWSCLIEAVEMIHEKSEQLGISEKDDSWIKPSAIQKYIDDRYTTMSYTLAKEL
jgi:hypothetical protein